MKLARNEAEFHKFSFSTKNLGVGYELIWFFWTGPIVNL